MHFTGDGLDLTPLDYSKLLVKLAEEGKIKPDSYSLGGSIEELELKFAKLLGKESAIFMPTGTLANQIAIRSLANGASKVIVQDTSHIYNDSGDCLQTLSNLNLIPLAAKRSLIVNGKKAVINKRQLKFVESASCSRSVNFLSVTFIIL